jgi:hypothetical protein
MGVPEESFHNSGNAASCLNRECGTKYVTDIIVIDDTYLIVWYSDLIPPIRPQSKPGFPSIQNWPARFS